MRDYAEGMKTLFTFALLFASCSWAHAELAWIRVSDDGRGFVEESTGKSFIPWGVNYDHDDSGELLDEYWRDRWDAVEEDFREINDLGANCVRVHLQFGTFMQAPDKVDSAAIAQLKKLLSLAETTGLYLDITGLACYHKKNVPAWYDELGEEDRWAAQAVFWKAIAQACAESPAVFCYDLMNEPVIGGAKNPGEWLAGEPLGGKYFVQRITLDVGDRKRDEVAAAWVEMLVGAIRQVDTKHLVTVGVIPWAHVWPNAKPVFYTDRTAELLDFVSVHFYPQKGEVDKALNAVRVYDVGKPVVVEEMFPLKCSQDELLDFVRRSRGTAAGWISFYWGKPADDYDTTTIAGSITAKWLKTFSAVADEMKTTSN